MGVKRGDIVLVVIPGSYGKPRPALVVQSDLFDEHPSVTILPITSHIRETPLFRLSLEPNQTTGLSKQSQVMVDKILTVPREKVGAVIGQVATNELREVGRMLAVFLGIV